MDLPIAVGLASATVTLLASAILVFLFVCRRCGHREDDLERGPSSTHVADGLDDVTAEQAKSAVRRFGWAEVESLTRRFSSEGVIGEGGFSTVYLASLPDSSLAAIKVHRSAASERLLQAFQQELDLLVRLHHPHIIRLLGYCNVREEGVMVLEYISNGSLHEKLHGGGEALPWARRTSIAYRVAQALEYLHEGCDPQVVHGDIKAANVLLDHRLEPKLCDFGCARAGFSGAVQPPCRTTRSIMTGSLGYVDPHYLRTGVVSKKSDVYSFGVLLLELLTGSEAFCAERERPLTWLVGPRLFEAEENGMGELVDSRLGGKYDTAEAAALASLAARCIGEQPSLRPSIAVVVRIMAEKMPSALMPIIHATSRETSRRYVTTTSKSL